MADDHGPGDYPRPLGASPRGPVKPRRLSVTVGAPEGSNAAKYLTGLAREHETRVALLRTQGRFLGATRFWAGFALACGLAQMLPGGTPLVRTVTWVIALAAWTGLGYLGNTACRELREGEAD